MTRGVDSINFVGRGERLEPLAEDSCVVFTDRQLSITRTLRPAGLMFTGEIDLTNSDAVATALGQSFRRLGDAHLDLRRLAFCDVSGIRALLRAAENLEVGRRLLLHGLPDQLQTVIRVTGWADLPTLELCECGVEQP